MSRKNPHRIESKSRDMVAMKIDYSNSADALTRTLSERDYGIDLLVELFDNGIPTGKIAFLQIKGTQSKIEKLKNYNFVSCPGISRSSLDYVKQNRIPFILIYASINNPMCFYYIDLQSCIATLINKLKPTQKEISVRIPVSNYVDQDLSKFFSLINQYYNP